MVSFIPGGRPTRTQLTRINRIILILQKSFYSSTVNGELNSYKEIKPFKIGSSEVLEILYTAKRKKVHA